MPNAFFQGEKFFKGASPPPHPLGYGPIGYMCPITWSSAVCETWKSIAVPRSNWLPNICPKAFTYFGQVYLMWPIFVKNLLILGNVHLCGRMSCLSLIHFYCSLNHKFEVWFDLILKPTTNTDYCWRHFWIFLLFRSFVKSTSHIFVWESASVLCHITFFQNQYVVFPDRMSLIILAKLSKNPRARLNLSVSPV